MFKKPGRFTGFEVVDPDVFSPGLTAAGSGTSHLSHEELARQETFFHVKRSGDLTFMGKQPDIVTREGAVLASHNQTGDLRVVNNYFRDLTDAAVVERYGPGVRKARGLVEPPARFSEKLVRKWRKAGVLTAGSTTGIDELTRRLFASMNSFGEALPKVDTTEAAKRTFGWAKTPTRRLAGGRAVMPSLETVATDGMFAVRMGDFSKMFATPGAGALAAVEVASWRSERITAHVLARNGAVSQFSARRLERIAKKFNHPLFGADTKLETVVQKLLQDISVADAQRIYKAVRPASNWSRFTGFNAVGYATEMRANHPGTPAYLRHEFIHSTQMSDWTHPFFQEENRLLPKTLQENIFAASKKNYHTVRKYGRAITGKLGWQQRLGSWFAIDARVDMEATMMADSYKGIAEQARKSRNATEVLAGDRMVDYERGAWGRMWETDFMDRAEAAGVRTPRQAQAALLARRGMTEADVAAARKMMHMGDHPVVGTGLWKKTVSGSRRMPGGYISAAAWTLGTMTAVGAGIHYLRRKDKETKA